MSASNTFVVGQCTRTRDSSVFMTVRAQSVDGAIRDLSSTSHNEFPPGRRDRAARRAGDPQAGGLGAREARF